jgi:hypothetical protein
MLSFFSDLTDSLKVNRRSDTYLLSIPPNLWNYFFGCSCRRRCDQICELTSSNLLRRLKTLVNFNSLDESRAAKIMLHLFRIQILQVIPNLLHFLYFGRCSCSLQIQLIL